jgi:hypothetical protein
MVKKSIQNLKSEKTMPRTSTKLYVHEFGFWKALAMANCEGENVK